MPKIVQINDWIQINSVQISTVILSDALPICLCPIVGRQKLPVMRSVLNGRFLTFFLNNPKIFVFYGNICMCKEKLGKLSMTSFGQISYLVRRFNVNALPYLAHTTANLLT